jgi:hypothetical protein
MSNPSPIIFTQDSPFFEMVTSFLAAAEGIASVFEKEALLPPATGQVAWYRGKVKPDLAIDRGQAHALRLSGDLTPDTVMKSLCGMLLCTAYTVADVHNDQSPEFEVFRHLRNAAAHGNYFYFKKDEPRRRASWGRFVIDDKLKGTFNPLSGIECIGDTISPADVLALLKSIERRLPKNRNEQTA